MISEVLIFVGIMEIVSAIMLYFTALKTLDAKASYELFTEQLVESKETNEYFLALWTRFWEEAHEKTDGGERR